MTLSKGPDCVAQILFDLRRRHCRDRHVTSRQIVEKGPRVTTIVAHDHRAVFLVREHFRAFGDQLAIRIRHHRLLSWLEDR